MSHQLNIFLLLFGALQGILMSLLLLKDSRRHQSNVLLTSFLVVVGLQLTFKVLSKEWLFENVQLYYALSYQLPFLAAPVCYLFVRARSAGFMFTKIDLLHFLPFLLGITHQSLFVWFEQGYAQFVPAWTLDAFPRMSLQLASLSIYSWLGIRLIRDSTRGTTRSGLNHFQLLVFICEATIIVTLGIMVQYADTFPDVRLLFLALTFLIYWISYKLVSQPGLFIASGQMEVRLKVETKLKYSHSGLKPEEAGRISQMVQDAMVVDRVFLNAELTIDILASSLGISRHHLSQVLNEQFNQSYFDYVSSFRLEEAKNRLSNGKNDHLSIAAIAFDSGFSSLSNFNDLFKKRFGKSPSKVRDQQVNRISA